MDEHLGELRREPVVLVHGSPDEPLHPPGSLPLVVCWIGTEFGGAGHAAADLVVASDDVDDVLSAIVKAPIAAATLTVLLRSIGDMDIEGALAAESSAYSTLQAGAEFAAWSAQRPPSSPTPRSTVVLVERTDDVVTITLDRPDRHNAISSQLRDELHAALRIGMLDDSVASILLRGNGPSFCSGGDLGEFGLRPDPAIAHVTRLTRSPARSIAAVSAITTARIHGATMGGGIELAAFAHRVVAHPDTIISLPEIHLGLIPGAGGCVSITRRIGRQRMAALALTGRRITATMAYEWGLVDAVDSGPLLE